MNKEEIYKKIFQLSSDEEIQEFVKARLNQLEENSHESTVGQNYTDSFKEYISNKTHYKAADKLDDNTPCPDLVYDDITPYVRLIKQVLSDKGYNELTLFSTIFYITNEYLGSTEMNIAFLRYLIYSDHKDSRVSIKTISDSGCAVCSETAGLAHNMFKFLGIDSEVICGGKNGKMHAYNFVYPNGYGNEPMVLYDPSDFVNFINGDKKVAFGFFKIFGESDYELFLSGEEVKIDLTMTKEFYHEFYRINLEGYVFQDYKPVYVYGLENAKKLNGSIKK